MIGAGTKRDVETRGTREIQDREVSKRAVEARRHEFASSVKNFDHRSGSVHLVGGNRATTTVQRIRPVAVAAIVVIAGVTRAGLFTGALSFMRSFLLFWFAFCFSRFTTYIHASRCVIQVHSRKMQPSFIYDGHARASCV